MFFYKGLLLVSDILLVNIAFFLALVLRFDTKIPVQYWNLYLHQWFILTLVHLSIGLMFKLYKCLLRYITTRELLYLVMANFTAGMVFFIYGTATGNRFPRTIYPIYLALLLLAMIFSRFSYKIANKVLKKTFRSFNSFQHNLKGTPKSHTLLIGAGDAAALIIREIKKSPTGLRKVVLALDDDKSKMFSSLNGVPIRGPIDTLESFIDDYEITEIIVAMPSAPKDRIAEILKICSKTSCKLKIFPGISASLTTDSSLKHLRNVRIEDLLGREEIKLDNPQIMNHIAGHTILVTGGGGSIGSELCRQISHYRPKQLVIFDIYENNAYDIQNELILRGFDRSILKVIIGSVRDKKKLDYVFNTYKPDIVFHAAAHKHVPLMEDSPEEAVKNNVFGTLNVARCARAHKVKKFILISTDKAVNPTNVMGATKRICEMIIQSINQTTKDTDYVAVRFGNVLGSNGSVIPLFKRQLEAGGPLTVTHPDIIRYFMTIPEAVSLILQSMSFATGGEIFVLDMGEPVKILDLATNFIKLSGFEPYKDIDITFTGLRPGEKLFEELLMSEEGLTKTSSNKIFIGNPTFTDFEPLVKELNTLLCYMEDPESLKQALSEVVPTYKISPEGCLTPSKTLHKQAI